MSDFTSATGAYRDQDAEGAEEVYSKPVRAGKRTYFFDVKATRGDDYYITITESRKKLNEDGTLFYDKHKIYLYKEDFERFAEGFGDVVAYIKAAKPEFFEEQAVPNTPYSNGAAPASSLDEEFDRL